MSDELNDIFTELRRFRAGWMARGWSWDRRLECAASTFDRAEIGEAERLARATFPHEYHERTIGRAPALVVAVAERTEGVRKDQRLFALGDGAVLAYGLWWPWGGESSSISFRVGIAGAVGQGETAELQEVFGARDY